MIRKALFALFIMLGLSMAAYAYYPMDTSWPKVSNFGEFRYLTPQYLHDGVDIACPIGTPLKAV